MLIAAIIGFIIGTRFKNLQNFTLSAFVVMCIIVLGFACMYGQYPYYDDFSFGTTAVSGLVGLFVGKLIFDRWFYFIKNGSYDYVFNK